MAHPKVNSLQRIQRYYSNGTQKKEQSVNKYLTNKNFVLFLVMFSVGLFIIHVLFLTLSPESTINSKEIQTPFHCKLASFIDYFCFTDLHNHYECIQSYTHKFITIFWTESNRLMRFTLKFPILLLSISIDAFAFIGEVLAYTLSELGDNCGKNMKLLRDFSKSLI
uniref:G_PROTEIN_RECEP_F1_2 domain-containing protein n=1 Tax=Parastrongyloides trichosuri TaxID=131310 RepID=A0A0N4ZG58_PARTI